MKGPRTSKRRGPGGRLTTGLLLLAGLLLLLVALLAGLLLRLLVEPAVQDGELLRSPQEAGAIQVDLLGRDILAEEPPGAGPRRGLRLAPLPLRRPEAELGDRERRRGALDRNDREPGGVEDELSRLHRPGLARCRLAAALLRHDRQDPTLLGHLDHALELRPLRLGVGSPDEAELRGNVAGDALEGGLTLCGGRGHGDSPRLTV